MEFQQQQHYPLLPQTSSSSIDDEWANFISSNYRHREDDMESEVESEEKEYTPETICMDLNINAPKASNIHISTKTIIVNLNTEINLNEVFWQIPVMQYTTPANGVIKKQMKFVSTTKEQLEQIEEKLTDDHLHVEKHVKTHIDNPMGRIKFKDDRKISIGISKKDILSYRCKPKEAFYNCFVLILRIFFDQTFKEFHVKVFNTGELEIPGIQSDAMFEAILDQLIRTLQPYVHNVTLQYQENSVKIVLMNSNFRCGFFINRESLFDILKMKYNLQAIYDPCSYPGIQCKFYYNPDIGVQNGCQISEENKHLYSNIKTVAFMIFRTGSVLIVGKCEEHILMQIYEFLKIVLSNEYETICQPQPNVVVKEKKKKTRKKMSIEMDYEYYTNHVMNA